MLQQHRPEDCGSQGSFYVSPLPGIVPHSSVHQFFSFYDNPESLTAWRFFQGIDIDWHAVS